MPTSADRAGSLRDVRSSKDVFCTPSPPRTQDPLPSTSSRPLVGISPTTTGIQEPLPSQDQRLSSITTMHIEEPETMQWSAQHIFPMSQASQAGPDYHMSVSFTPGAPGYYHYAQNGMSYNDNLNLSYSSQYPSPSCPRSYNSPDLTGLPHVGMTESYPPAAYQIDPPKHHDLSAFSEHGVDDHLIQMSDEHEHHYGPHIKHEIHSGYNSPYSDITRASTPDEPSRYPHGMFGVDDGPIDKEQPYAQLIYKALLQADGHTMILRDIYDWFKMYTDKASASETKGWQNSIRHNLSMNGAFEKVDQPCEESRKGFMWRLTDEALREGVKSTTRYRSKQPNKRGHRTQHPQPQRQASGAKGGQAARRSAHLKRSKRQQDMYASRAGVRSVPAAFDPIYTVGMRAKNQSYVLHSPYYSSETNYSSYPNTTADPPHNNATHSNHNASLDFGTQSYTASPLLDAAYVLEQSPSTSLFTNSPSPSALDEPRTPLSQGWDGDVGLEFGGLGCESSDGMGYQEYVG